MTALRTPGGTSLELIWRAGNETAYWPAWLTFGIYRLLFPEKTTPHGYQKTVVS